MLQVDVFISETKNVPLKKGTAEQQDKFKSDCNLWSSGIYIEYWIQAQSHHTRTSCIGQGKSWRSIHGEPVDAEPFLASIGVGAGYTRDTPGLEKGNFVVTLGFLAFMAAKVKTIILIKILLYLLIFIITDFQAYQRPCQGRPGRYVRRPTGVSNVQ